MGVGFETKGKEQDKIFYVNSPVPYAVEEIFDGYLHEHDDIALGEVLQNQESVLQSLQGNAQNDIGRTSSDAPTRSNARGENMEGRFLVNIVAEEQMSLDEEIARNLQELEFSGTSVGETAETETGDSRVRFSRENAEGNSSNTSNPVVRDVVDPDNMSYEELQSLGETIGTESRGLSDELISLLPFTIHKTGLFTKKEKQECVICCMAYKNRDKLTKLACQHQYHKSCISKWLKINKACPICTEEVFG